MSNPITPSETPPPPLQIGMLLYPGLTLLDLAGPQAVLGHHGKTHLLWKTLDPILSDSGVSVLPTTTFADCPTHLDVLFAPGGMGSIDMIADLEVTDFMRKQAETARYVTSVCTGSHILAAAGLLDGCKAATHWATYGTLTALGVEGVRSRVVVDGNRVTGGGVTAGIDFGLTLLAELRGATAAKFTQLLLEYDPEPPFNSGSPDVAEPEIVAIANGIFAELNEANINTARSVKAQRVSRLAEAN